MTDNRERNSWYRLSQDEVLERLGSQRDGLSQREAESRLQKYGPNAIRNKEKTSVWKILLDQFTSPLIFVLLGALVITLAIQHYGDAIVIAAVLVINASIGFTQEFQAQKAVQALMKMVSPKAKVRRNGQVRQIDGECIVPGDLVILSEGNVVPADMRLTHSSSLQINESALTGESVPASKTDGAMDDTEDDLPPADQRNMAFLGTAVTSGRAEGIVTATGSRTELGEIAESIRETGDVTTPLQRRLDRMAKWIAAAILVVAAGSFVVGWMTGNDITEMFLLAVALAVSAIPEGLPVVVTVALAIGVRRMAERRAVVRNLPAVETLGSTTVIVSDKTGTLTQNHMTVTALATGSNRYRVSGETLSPEGDISRDGAPVDVGQDQPLYWTLLAGLLNNTAHVQENDSDPDRHKTPSRKEDRRDSRRASRQPRGNPMEVALLISALKAGLSREQLQKQYARIDDVPFATERRFSATIHDVPTEQDGPLVLVKGAPEIILQMCAYQLADQGQSERLDREALLRQNDDLASEGLRVLAMAVGRGKKARESITNDRPGGMVFVGMQGLLDPPRPEAVTAVDRCHESGIRVIMVTGDHARTAAAIAAQVHLDRDGTSGRAREPDESSGLPEVHTGREVSEASDADLDDMLRRTNVFARVMPEQKLRIVERLKANHQVVAVTGDGVNDAPALNSAHLGVAMGQAGTDVAKEASDMVITDDNFASVYSAVEEGRTAFRNIRMATFFLLSTGAAEVILVLSVLGLGWPLPLLPAQILWVNVVTNGIADVALAFEPGERALYRRRPRPPDEGVLDYLLVERLVVVGIWLAAGTLAIFYWDYFYRSSSLELARVSAVTTLVLFQAVHVFNCRSEDVSMFKKSLLSNKVLFLGVLASLGLHVAALYLPWTQELLGFRPLSSWDVWFVAFGMALTAIAVNELHKWLRPRVAPSRQGTSTLEGIRRAPNANGRRH